MSFVDPTPQRVSACPVHFIWDGKGRGRSLVRAGFLGLLVASGAALVASALHIDVVRQAGAMLAAVAATSWLMGHVLGLKPFNRARLAKPRG